MKLREQCLAHSKYSQDLPAVIIHSPMRQLQPPSLRNFAKVTVQSSDETPGFFIIFKSHSIDGPCLPLDLQQCQPGVLRHLNLKGRPRADRSLEDQLFTTLISETRKPTLRSVVPSLMPPASEW